MPNDHQAAVEQTIRDLIADNPDLPIRADFYRGANPERSDSFASPTRYEYASTPACEAEWFVSVRPASFEVAVAARGRWFLGENDVIGRAAGVEIPQTGPGVVDVDALAGSRFHVELLAAVREKAAVVEQMRANVNA